MLRHPNEISIYISGSTSHCSHPEYCNLIRLIYSFFLNYTSCCPTFVLFAPKNNKYLLRTYYVPGTLLHVAWVNLFKIHKISIRQVEKVTVT